ncbi:glycosyltransferase family 2 protein [Wenyingzhuangia aestuarii]|uniref:glycosyltransferase family 2 protein n=1 Tax=Wenyingzhuangia aestuarii TaxID=1647582 RepID=UPI0014392879|nr:glycosyltransferase family A protein [Wenyingzhuangia aestuarii]NJB81747.1 glycosyltransferase involved in cell wall biosynthesis [Wenyingzhuangia aestuarii]
MVVVYHKNNQVTEVVTHNNKPVSFNSKASIANVLFKIAEQFPEKMIFWCHQSFKESLNLKDYDEYFHHHRMMLSYNPSSFNFLSNKIGYVERSSFVNVNKGVRYPTWQMSSVVGVIHASILLKRVVKPHKDLDYFLNSFAKLAMPKGLLCYSEPKLLKKVLSNNAPTASKYILYKFVRQHYKFIWLFLLFFNELIFDKKLSILPFISALFYKSKKQTKIDVSNIKVNAIGKQLKNRTIDVLIPTLGRKEHLYNVLLDLSKQTLLPNRIIIVEQNAEEGSVSELDYLKNDWPFKIDHTFIHQLGACNARNIALSRVTSDWVFFADDDVRFENDLLSKSFDYIQKFGISSLTMSCLQKGEVENNQIPFQWGGFGTNASLVESDYLKNCSFKPEHEFGYGEDTDFGMQLKNKGCDIIYLPYVKMLHLKAPIGGFRAKFSPMWQNDAIQPKPSPTVMAYNLKHLTPEQLKGYKTLLFIKFYKKQSIKNPFLYIKTMNLKWKQSVYWATKMIKNEN